MEGYKDLTLLDAFAIFRAKLWKIVMISAVLAAGVYGYCSYMQPWYSYVALLKPAELGPIAKDATGSQMAGKLLGAISTSPLFQETLSYLEFRYLDAYRPPGTAPHLKKINENRAANLLELVANGSTPEEAKGFLEGLLKDLQAYYQPMISAAQENAKSNLTLLDTKIKMLERAIRETENAIQKLGYSVVLVQGKLELEAQLFRARGDHNDLKSATDPALLHNYQYLDIRMVSPNPTSPRTFFYVLATFLFSGFVLTTLFVVAVDNERRRAWLQTAKRGPVPPPFYGDSSSTHSKGRAA